MLAPTSQKVVKENKDTNSKRMSSENKRIQKLKSMITTKTKGASDNKENVNK
jgi:hypothetical protein